MGVQLFTNNANSTLAAGIGTGATALTLTTGDGALFPNPSGGDYFLATLCKVLGGVEVSIEVVKVTARATDVLTIVRAQEGTTGTAYASGDRLSLRLTAAFATRTVTADDAQAITGQKTMTTPILVGTQETKVAMAANNIDLATGSAFSKTISGAATLTVSNVPASGKTGSFTLNLTNGGSAVITWWSGVKWDSGTAPTLTTSGRDRLEFFTEDGGTTWDGFLCGKGMA